MYMYRSSLLDFERFWGKKSVEETVEKKEADENVACGNSSVVEEPVVGDIPETSTEIKMDNLIDAELEQMKNEDVDAKNVTLYEAPVEPSPNENLEEPPLEPMLVPVSKPSLFKRLFSCGSSTVVA